MNVTDLVRRELLGEFRQSARERLDRISATWIGLESQDGKRGDHGTVLLRELHTLKGEAKLMGYAQVSQLVHQLEELVVAMERGGFRRANEAGDLVLRTVDNLGEQIARSPEDAELASTGALEKRITSLRDQLGATPVDRPVPAAGAPEPVGAEAFVRVDVATAHHLAEEASEAVIAQARYRHAIDHLRRSLDELATVITARNSSESVASVLERLKQTVDRLAEDIYEADSTIRALEVDSRRLRMVPLAPVFRTQMRAVRTLAQELGKKAAVHINDGNIAVDREVVERLGAPLVHLLRNCVDHGLEMPAARLSSGKPETGQITIAAERVGSEVVVTVEDDGAGVDLDAVRARGLALGLIGDDVDETDLVSLLFNPGFSTRQRATETSGRGVGLDVVKSQVESLGGSVRVASQRGRGTRFELRVPVNVALTRALIVSDNGQLFAVPHTAVDAVIAIDANTIETLHTRRHVRFRDAWIPVVELAAALALPANAVSSNELRAIVVRHEEQRVAIIVDAWHGDSEIVIKPLGALATSRAAMGACTVDGGEVALVLAPSELVSRGLGEVPRIRLAAKTAPVRGKQRVLLVEDSTITRTMIAQLLRMFGYEIAEAEDGQRALLVLEEFAADVVITDVEMPNVDGIELIWRVRADARWSQLPIVVLSTRGSVEDKQRAVTAGANAYLVKTEFSESALREVLTRHVEKGRS
jgi:chemotaxis protein histidine kinase CheA/ActR/RegA family two-component response regulator